MADMFYRILIWCLVIPFTLPATENWPQRLELHPEARIRVQTFARRQEVVLNPILWSQFTYIIPEGTRVKEGDVLFELDMSVPEHRMRVNRNRLAETENQVARQLGGIEQRITNLRDQAELMRDQRDVQRARLAYLKVLPRAEDVAIARGRLQVAEQNLLALRHDRDTAQRRLEAGLVPPATLEQAETALALQKARTEYARNRLRTASLPSHPHEQRIVELTITNQTLELEKLEQEILSQEEILRIEQRSANRRIADLLREQGEIEQELAQRVIRAPREGVVIYTNRLKRELASGGKPARGMALAEIPDPASMALLGRITEDLRSVFQVGDPVEVRLNPDPNRLLTGRIASISPLPRDISETDRRTQGDASAATGVKVFDVTIHLDEVPLDIPFGVYGTARLRSADPITGLAVPLSWVRIRDGKFHLSVNGIFQAVDGIPSGALFMLREAVPGAARLGPDGEWAFHLDTELAPEELAGDRVAASGELTPLESQPVFTPSIRAWDLKVNRLAPEDSLVSRGDLLAELDSERITQLVQNAEADVIRRTGERESEEENLAQRRREADFQLARARNQLEIKRLEYEMLTQSIQSSQLHQARQDFTIATIQLQDAERELLRMRATPELTAPAEIRRRERDVERRRHNLELVKIQLEQVSKGADEIQRSQARLDLLRQEASLAQLEASTRRGLTQAESQTRRRLRQERSSLQNLQRARDEQASLQIYAPADGLVKYENLWDGLGLAKLRVGMNVWGGMRLFSLSDSSRMVVRVPVSERYVRHLRTGLRVQVRIPSEGSRLWNGQIQRINEVLEPADHGGGRGGLYANQEPPLEQVLHVEVLLTDELAVSLKPGAVAHVIFPFAR